MVDAIEFLPAAAKCNLKLDSGSVLHPGGNKFDPLVRHAPALLTIDGVREVTFEGRYQLNATIVDIDATALPDGEHVEYTFDLSGGTDSDAYMVKLRIVGKGFTLGGR